jgi:pimeloyl-ACP methyl ester carboxylesterase
MVDSHRSLAVVVDGNRLAAGAYVPERPRGTVVVLHGIPSVAPLQNPEAAAPNDDGYPGLARRFSERRWATVWVDMRGVRGSRGHFSIEGWVRDLEATIAAARAQPEASALPLAVVGSSAGGAVAVEATWRGAPVDALVLLGTPAAWSSFATDASDAVRRITHEAGMTLSPDVLADPSAWAAEFETVSTERSVATVSIPILIVHGTADEVVPVDHAKRIFERAPRAELRVIDGAGHQLRLHPGVFELVADWLDRTLS